MHVTDDLHLNKEVKIVLIYVSGLAFVTKLKHLSCT